MSLGEIAARVELPPSTVHGIVRTLVVHGMVVQERDSSRYRLGPATLRLGNVYLETLELRSRVATWADDLAQRTGCSVRVGVLLLTDVVVVYHAPRPDGSRQMPEVGIVIPAYASALGKALLASDAAACAIVLARDMGNRSMTGVTLTDPEALRVQLAEVRASGVATESEEAVLGECSIAAPITDGSDVAIGAIGLVAPSAEWPLPATAIDALRAAARAVSHELGATRWPPSSAG